LRLCVRGGGIHGLFQHLLLVVLRYVSNLVICGGRFLGFFLGGEGGGVVSDPFGVGGLDGLGGLALLFFLILTVLWQYVNENPLPFRLVCQSDFDVLRHLGSIDDDSRLKVSVVIPDHNTATITGHHSYASVSLLFRGMPPFMNKRFKSGIGFCRR